jgi:hypothetical protein
MKYVLLLVILLTSCAPGFWKSLPEKDKNRWFLCQTEVLQYKCGEWGTVKRHCAWDTVRKYSEELSEDRIEWLINNGCPPAVIENYVGE